MGTRLSTMGVIISHQLRHDEPGTRAGVSAASRGRPPALPGRHIRDWASPRPATAAGARRLARAPA